MDGGVYNYCKEAFFQEEEKGKNILLLIEGSAVKTWVFVNGSLAGECNYPYMQFYVNLSPWLHYGEVNQIRIVANSLNLSSRFYVGGGIFRDVYLLKGDKVFFTPDSMRITTQSLCGEGARILFENTIANKNPYSLTGRLRFSVTDSVGQSVLCVEYPVMLPAGKDYHFSKELFLDQITPWNEHHPALI